MKLIRILAIIVIAIFVVKIFNSFIPGFIDGWNEAGDSKDYNSETVYLTVKPTDAVVTDSLFNSKLKESVPYTIREVHTQAETPTWYKITIAVSGLFAIFALFGFYCLVRLIISTTRGDVFTRKNVRRMRFFIYSTLLVGVIVELSQYLLYREWTAQFVLKGYEVVDYETKSSWLAYMVLALFTEIFAVGVKIKEEQDLTI